eukprot:scaffold120711_cov32-Tisochrysis_lutea.AAC.4
MNHLSLRTPDGDELVANHVCDRRSLQVLNCNDHQLPPELACLAINLAHVPAAADVIAEDNGVRHLVERLLQTRDLLLLKLIRAMVAHEAQALQAAPLVSSSEEGLPRYE